jgi:glyceraldehyde 3-phosphate dehydrogenase
MVKNVAINWIGRIGRAALKIMLENDRFNIVAVNDLIPLETFVYLLKYDSVYGRYRTSVNIEEGQLAVYNKKIAYIKEKEPSNLPWKNMNIDIVFECTRRFTDRAGLFKHISAGARYVILSTASKSEEIATTRALPQFAGKFDGVSLRVPVPAGSISDLTIVTSRATSKQEINRT